MYQREFFFFGSFFLFASEQKEKMNKKIFPTSSSQNKQRKKYFVLKECWGGTPVPAMFLRFSPQRTASFAHGQPKRTICRAMPNLHCFLLAAKQKNGEKSPFFHNIDLSSNLSVEVSLQQSVKTSAVARFVFRRFVNRVRGFR